MQRLKSGEKLRSRVQPGCAATAHVVTTNHMHRFEEVWSLGPMNTTDRITKLRTDVNLPGSTISNPVYREDKSASPTAVVEYDLK